MRAGLRLTFAATVAGAVALVFIAAMSGCGTSSVAPEAVSDDETPHYAVRSSPDSVIANLATAYEHEDLEQYLNCLAEDFTFYLNPLLVEESEGLPFYWGKAYELVIHSNMFGAAGFVDNVDLELAAIGEPVEIPGELVTDPVCWEYRCSVDLCVVRLADFAYIATAPSVFVFQTDPDEVGPRGEALWEILLWYDLPDDDGRPVEDSSWTGIKLMFL